MSFAAMVTGTSGWALTSSGREWTDDGGASWTNITPAGLSAHDEPIGAGFRDGSNGFVVVWPLPTPAPAGMALAPRCSSRSP